MIKEFQNEYRWLSNFWAARVEYDGDIFPSVEHAYQAAKFPRQERIKFLSCQAGEAKKYGKSAKLPLNWEEIKVPIMEELVRKKFAIPEYKNKLIKTGNEFIQEGNMWYDKFWGVDLRTGEGRNELGKIIMKIRKEV